MEKYVLIIRWVHYLTDIQQVGEATEPEERLRADLRSTAIAVRRLTVTTSTKFPSFRTRQSGWCWIRDSWEERSNLVVAVEWKFDRQQVKRKHVCCKQTGWEL